MVRHVDAVDATEEGPGVAVVHVAVDEPLEGRGDDGRDDESGDEGQGGPEPVGRKPRNGEGDGCDQGEKRERRARHAGRIELGMALLGHRGSSREVSLQRTAMHGPEPSRTPRFAAGLLPVN